MSVRRQARPRRGAGCGILEQQCRTYRTTDSVSMPALATLSLLPHALSGAVHIAGLVVDALDSTRSIAAVLSHAESGKKTSTKSDPNQKVDASQLANVFAAYLAAVHPATVPIAAATTITKVPAPQQVQATSKQSVKNGPASLAPLAVMLAAGPTTAISAAMALRSAPATTNIPAPGGVHTALGAHAVAPQKAAKVASAPPAPAIQSAAAVLHPAAAVVHPQTPREMLPVASAPAAQSAAAIVRAHPPHKNEIAAIVRPQLEQASKSSTPVVAVPLSRATHTSAGPVIVRAQPPQENASSKGTPSSSPILPALIKLQNAVDPTLIASKIAGPVPPLQSAAPAKATRPVATSSTAPVVKSSSPSKGEQLKSPSGSRQLPERSLGGRTPAGKNNEALSKGRKPPEPSLNGQAPTSEENAPTSNEQTTTVAPVLALNNVPVPTVTDNPQPTVVVRASRRERMGPPEVPASPSEEGASSSSWERGSFTRERVEPTPVPEGPAPIVGLQTKLVGWAESSRPIMLRLASLEDSAHPTSRDDSQPQPASTQAASPQPSVAPPIAAGPVNTAAGNAPATASNEAQTNGSAAEQLSRAFVAQANFVNREGRTDFHLRLQPPQLGSVQIHLTATDHTVWARVIVAQDGTRQLIEGQVQQLRQSLAESGLVLGNFEVTHHGGGFSQGGRHQPPELPTLPLPRPVAPTSRTVVRTSLPASSGGINILA
jgi:hypothetical protein